MMQTLVHQNTHFVFSSLLDISGALYYQISKLVLFLQLQERSKAVNHLQPVAQQISGPRCVARFDYEATEPDDLGFVAGDVIRLMEHVGDEWLRGELSGKTGVFPTAFVEIVEHLPSPAAGKVFLVSA